MRKKQKRLSKRKLLIPMALMVFLFAMFKIGETFASTDVFNIVNAEVFEKSETVDVNSLNFKNSEVNKDITFHKIGDSVIYRIKVKNNSDKNYTIKQITDDNTNPYVAYEYDKYEGTKVNAKDEVIFLIKEKYCTELTDVAKRTQDFTVNFTFTLEDEEGNVTDSSLTVNPKTGDNIGTYIAISIGALLLLVMLTRQERLAKIRNKYTTRSSRRTNAKKGNKGFKLFSVIALTVLLLPIMTKASTNENSTIILKNKISFKDKLVVTYEINGIEYEKKIEYNEKIEEIENPEKEGYIFERWEKEDGTEFNPATTPITDDEKIVAKFKPIIYTISYDLENGTLEDGKTNPTQYTIESDDIELNKPSKEGYTFIGWTGTELIGTVENVTISKGKIGNRIYTANWVETNYSITYHLNGGIVAGNPNSYTIKTNDINLNKPTKVGYTFDGWLGTDLTGKTEDVKIMKGSKGNKEYTANWIPINYTISYKGLTNEELRILNNPTTYNMDAENKVLNNPSNRTDNDGDEVERFIGWKENETVSTNITIPPIGIGNKVYEAVWATIDPNTYTVTYNLNGGMVSTSNKTSFTKFDTFTLNNPTKRGYTFTGWTGSNGSAPQTTLTVPTGTRENLSYEANWTEDRYAITYNLNGGTVNTSNPREYTVNSDDIILSNPTKTGYTFKGWTGTELTEKTMEVTIPINSVGNREYLANFDANTYTIIFNGNTSSGSMANQTMIYDKEESLMPNTFTKTGYTFTGWNTKADGTGTHYDEGQTVSNLLSEQGAQVTLYAQWKINNYEVIFTNDNTTYDVQSIDYNEKVLRPEDPSKENAEFVGWYLNNSLYNFDSLVTEDMELVARYYSEPTINLNLNSKYGRGSNKKISATYTVDEYVGLKSIEYYYYKNGTYASISNINELDIGSYVIYAKVTDNKDNFAIANSSTVIISKLYDVAKIGDYVEYVPTSTQYKSTTYDGISGSINPSNTTSWRVLSKNSDGTIDIIPTTTAGKLNYGGNVEKTAGGGSDWDNIVYEKYSNSLQKLANSFINSTFAISARAVSENDFNTIKNANLIISDNYAINKQDYTSNSWTGNGEGGANWNYYIYYANRNDLEKFIIWYKYAGTGGQSSTAYSILLGVRPIVRLKANVLENAGNGTINNKWILTTE